MMRLVVLDEARADLRQIARYGRRTWGASTSRDYQDLLIQTLAKLMENPRRGRRQESLSPGLRRINVRRHAIFFKVRNDDVVVVRVLHQSMDIRSGLFESEGDR
jgi:toxin ParE1/3/4